MSILNTEDISNPDIRLDETRITPIVQIYREAMFTTWSSNGIWPEWAWNLRYDNGEDRFDRFKNQTRVIESFIKDRIGQCRIDELDRDITAFLDKLFVDVEFKKNKRETGNAYFIYNRRSGNLVMSVIIAYLGV
ncbi:MAG: hypothetical protein K2N48_07285 [Muribaculaceae bacterium]|nr:hypothetical protein [Muribaculaceae bacterium]